MAQSRFVQRMAGAIVTAVVGRVEQELDSSMNRLARRVAGRMSSVIGTTNHPAPHPRAAAPQKKPSRSVPSSFVKLLNARPHGIERSEIARILKIKPKSVDTYVTWAVREKLVRTNSNGKVFRKTT
jgi:hypothetical protein